MRVLRLSLIFFLLLISISATLGETHFFDRQLARIDNYDNSIVQQKVLNHYILDKIQGEKVFLYVTEDELFELQSEGFEIQYIPDPARLMFEELKKRSASGLDELDEYRSFAETTAELQEIAQNNPSICHLYSAGQSVQGRDLWMMEISDNVLVEEDEPEFVYISTMHGDEVVGKELCMNFINYLVDEYDTNAQIQNLINNVHIYIMPHMNPDGTEVGSRFNADGIDLNRSFPDRIVDPYVYPVGRPQEVRVLMEFFSTHSPVLAANFHGGTIVANYPYDTNPEGASVTTPCPDNLWYQDLSNTYAALNDSMLGNPDFPGGTTNGAAWYNINGGMQDFTMNSMGCAHVTIELSNPHWPDASQIPVYWGQNRESMIAYMEGIFQGIRGIVTDAETGDPIEAIITVDDNPTEVFTDPDVGDFYRLLLPGTFTLNVEAYGYDTVTIPDVVVSEGELTRQDIEMSPSNRGYVYYNFQMGADGFTHYAGSEDHVDQWHLSSTRSSTSPNSWKCGDTGTGTYTNNVDALLESPEFTLLPESYLTFWHYMDVEISDNHYPYGYDGTLVEILPDGATQWVTLTPEGGYPYLARNTEGNGVLPHDTPFYSGFVNGRQAMFDLSGYTGDVKIRFHFLSDISVMREGWYIDDFQIRNRASHLTFAPENVSFGDTEIGDSSFVNLTITNDGELPYEQTLTRVTLPDIFRFDSNRIPDEILPGETVQLEIGFFPVEATLYEDELTIYGTQNYTITLTGNGAVDVDQNDSNIPDKFAISEIYPNPFNPSTTIVVAVPQSSLVQLSIFNVTGQKVSTLASDYFTAGYHELEFNGSGLASGIYFVQLNIPGKLHETRKIIMLQ